MDSDNILLDRRAMLQKTSVFVATLATIPIAIWGRAAGAAKADRAVLRYQDQPKDGKICTDCWAYVVGRNATEGTCKAIEGPVSPNGWCMAFSPKNTRTGKRAKPA